MSIGKRGTASMSDEKGLEKVDVEKAIEFLQKQIENGQTVYSIQIETDVPEVKVI